jgi:hypothetical protein
MYPYANKKGNINIKRKREKKKKKKKKYKKSRKFLAKQNKGE